MTKWLILGVVLVGVALGGYYWLARSATATATTLPATTSAEVVRGSIFQAVASTGKVVSNLDVDIKCKASGSIVTLPFDVSQAVKKDDLLVQLDPVDEQRAVRQAEAALAETQAKLEQSKQNLLVAQQTLLTVRHRSEAAVLATEAHVKDTRTKADRRKQLWQQNLGSQEDYDTAETAAVQAAADLTTAKVQLEDVKGLEIGLEVKKQDIKVAEAQMMADQLALSNAQQRLADTKVVSPIDGVVAALNVQKGQIISSGITNVGGGTSLMTLSDLSRVFVLASVDESDIGKVTVDQPVMITVDAYPGMRFRGKVVRIATKGVNVTNVVTFEVKVEVLDKNKSLLKPEMTANVQIISAQKDDVLTVPVAAIARKEGKLVATVLKPGAPNEERPVQLGLNDGENWEITGGLSEGETVLVRKDDAMSRWRADSPRPGGMRPGMMMGGGGGGRRP